MHLVICRIEVIPRNRVSNVAGSVRGFATEMKIATTIEIEEQAMLGIEPVVAAVVVAVVVAIIAVTVAAENDTDVVVPVAGPFVY